MSFSDMDPVLLKAKIHLEEIAISKSAINPQILDRASAKLRFDTEKLLVNQPSTVTGLLPAVVEVVKTPLDDDYTPVIDLLREILSTRPFDEILKLLPVEDMIESLKSGLVPLQKACIEQIQKAEPADLVANSPLIQELVKIIADVDSEISGQVLKALVRLAKDGELVRRRLFSDKECYQLLVELKSGDRSNAILESRLMELIEGILPVLDPASEMIPWELVVLDPDSNDDGTDILAVLTKIQFYKTIMANKHPGELVSKIDQQIKIILNLYLVRDTNPEVGMFLLSEIFAFWGAMSQTEPQAFKQLDTIYSISDISSYKEKDILFLSLLDPGYMAEFRPEVIQNIPYKALSTKALQRAYHNEKSYHLIRPTSSDQLLQLPYLELMVLIATMATLPWGFNDLMNNMPQVMTKLLENEDIRDRDVLAFRRQAIEALLDNYSASELGPWHGGLKMEYRKIIFGDPDQTPGVLVADDSAQ